MSTKLYVGNLSFRVTSDDLQAHFAQAGNVETQAARSIVTAYAPSNTQITSTTPSASPTNSTTISVGFTSNFPGATFRWVRPRAFDADARSDRQLTTRRNRVVGQADPEARQHAEQHHDQQADE